MWITNGSANTDAVEEWTGPGAPIGVWATGGSLNTARDQVFGGAGTQTAALLAGGSPPPAGATVTESYNGTNWTEVNDLATGRRALGMSGATNTASLAILEGLHLQEI